MPIWREHDLNHLSHRQQCEVITETGRYEAFWDATYRFFWIYCPREEVLHLDRIKEWRAVPTVH